MAATVREAVRELMVQTMATIDALLEASDHELAMPSSHACAQGKGRVDPHHERHGSRKDSHGPGPGWALRIT